MSTFKISLCVVALNEESFLPNLLEDIKRQEYSHELMEIVLVDGGSCDRTKEIMQNFAQEDNGFYNVQVLDNPKRIQAAGWNVAIIHATGDVISRIDAHTSITKEFTKYVIANIEDGEDVVGGIRPCIIENDTLWAQTLLAVENSLFGSSINKSRHSGDKSYVKTMFHASYKRDIFEKVGLFNEALLRTEDNEMHYRIRQAGYKLLYDPRIVSYQYARSSFSKMIRQKYGNGFWIGLTIGVCPGCISIYHFIPFVFLMGIIATTGLALCGIWQLAVLMWTIYLLFTMFAMVMTIAEGKGNRWAICMPILFLILHLSYGIGTMIGLVRMPKWRKKYK